jgi:hypothetical protein
MFLKIMNIFFYDITARTIVAIGEVKIDEKETNLVVVFTKKGDKFYVVTAYQIRG